MTDHDARLVALRPAVATQPAPNPDEDFQNGVLRPILKMQHGKIRDLFQKYLLKRKVNLSGLGPDERKAYVKSTFQKDLSFRNQLIGLVIGLMTEDEWNTYGASRDLSRRLGNLLVQRMQSTLEDSSI